MLKRLVSVYDIMSTYGMETPLVNYCYMYVHEIIVLLIFQQSH
jgi:hypothetical protein